MGPQPIRPTKRERSERPPVPKVSTVDRRFASKLTESAEDLQRILCSPAIEREFFGRRPPCGHGIKIIRPCKAVSKLGRNGEETGFSALRLLAAFSDPFDEAVVGACSDDLGELGKANRGQPLRRDRSQAAVWPFLDEDVVDVLWPSGEELSQHIVILPLTA